MSNGLVSIVLPTYNGEKYIRLSLDSCIEQTYKNWELIVVDDGSKDATAEIVAEYSAKDSRIKYFKNEKNLRLPRTLNRGFSLANGDYLTWTSDDNVFYPTAIEKMVNMLETDKEAQFVFATADIIDDEGKVVEIIKAPYDYEKAIIGWDFVGACFMYTRKAYEETGEYDPDMVLTEDYDYWLRLFSHYHVANISEALYGYRWHDGSLTSTESKDKISLANERVILKNLDSFGKLSTLQKFYLYRGLHNRNQGRTDKKARNKYKSKYRIYNAWYFVFIRVPNKINSILKKSS